MQQKSCRYLSFLIVIAVCCFYILLRFVLFLLNLDPGWLETFEVGQYPHLHNFMARILCRDIIILKFAVFWMV